MEDGENKKRSDSLSKKKISEDKPDNYNVIKNIYNIRVILT